jgi:hypothetical protein
MFFDKDPEIVFTHVACPVCHEKTGPDTICFNDKVKPQTIKTIDGTSFTARSPSCHFRQNKQIRAETNYTVSKALIDYLSDNTLNISYISALTPYSFVFFPANLVPEDSVKNEIANNYRSFIKRLNSLESDLVEDKKINVEITINGKTKSYSLFKSLTNEIESIKNIIPFAEIKINDK